MLAFTIYMYQTLYAIYIRMTRARYPINHPSTQRVALLMRQMLLYDNSIDVFQRLFAKQKQRQHQSSVGWFKRLCANLANKYTQRATFLGRLMEICVCSEFIRFAIVFKETSVRFLLIV